MRGAGLTLYISLGACSTPAPEPAPPPAAAAPVEVPQPAKPPPKIDMDRLDELLEQGYQALKAGRLLTPIDNCAYDYYREALKVAPGHPAALHGLERIAERYVAMAEQAAERGQYETARKMLEQAKMVDPNLDSIAAAQTQIDLRSAAQRQRAPLDATQLSARSPDLSGQLKVLGAQAKAQDAWVVIRARNDADGRWIYQQMAAAPGPRRIRAELTLGSPPVVDLLRLPSVTDPAPAGEQPQ